MIIWRILVGLSQLTWTWASPSPASGSVRYPTHARPAPIGSAPVARTPVGRQPAGQHVVEDRQVVGREVPDHVDVGLHQAEVDADRVDELDVAELAADHQLADLLHGGRVAVGVVAHQHQPALLGQVHHRAAPRHAVGQRLLDQHVLAGAEGVQAEAVVGAGRRGDRDGLDGGVVQHPLEPGR